MAFSNKIFVEQSTKVRRREEVWRIGKPEGRSSSPVGMVLCARSPLPLFFPPSWTKTPQTVSNTPCKAPQDSGFGKKSEGIRKEFQASKDFP